MTMAIENRHNTRDTKGRGGGDGPGKSRFYRRWMPGLVIVLSVVIDQVVKNWVLHHPAWHNREVTSFFDFTLVYNRGISFGLFSNWSQFGPFWAIVAGVICGGLFVWSLRLSHRARMAIAMIIGGAIGNVIDRIYHGAVVDFIDIHWAGWHWPAFNIADGLIFIGICRFAWVYLPAPDHAP